MPYPTPEQERAAEHGSTKPPRQPGDEVVLPAMDPGEDPKGWDRASIQLWTHPLHPRPRLTREDLLFPEHADRLRALGDALVFALCVIGLAFFPLYIAFIVLPGLSRWCWMAAPALGLLGGMRAYVRMVSTRLEDLLDKHEAS